MEAIINLVNISVINQAKCNAKSHVADMLCLGIPVWKKS